MAVASDKVGENSRRLKRKEARLAQKQNKHQSWVERQKHIKVKRNQQKPAKRDLKNNNMKEKEISLKESDSERDDRPAKTRVMKGSEVNLKLETKTETSSGIKEKTKTKRKKTEACHTLDAKINKRKTKFEEFLGMQADARLAEEDLEMERRLAKKLKVKKVKSKGDVDNFADLLGDLPSVLDSLDGVYDQIHSKEVDVDDDEIKGSKSIDDKKTKKKKKKKPALESEGLKDDDASHKEQFEDADPLESRKEGETIAKLDDGHPVAHEVVPSNVKYIAPHLRSQSTDESKKYSQIRRRLRGLLNRLSESNVESITGEVSTLFLSVSRIVASQIITEEVLASCSQGPRGNEQYASVFAAFVAGLSCMVGIDFGAKLMASLAKSFEDEYLKEDSLSLRNLTLLLSCLCIYGVCSSDLLYDFMIKLSARLTETDVSTILTILKCCGMKLRGDDPDSMKKFVLGVQSRVNDLKASAGEGQGNTYSKRMEFMLETICDIKNNKKRAKEDLPQQTRIKKWLQKLGVENVEIRGIKWDKLLDPNKKGQWWLSGDLMAAMNNVDEVASTIDKEVTEAQKMLQLAADQRMNTDTRRSIFCVIMSGEDYIDAFEKLLRLDLQGKQDREIMRVLLECCLQEKVFNKYYTALASRLCSHDKNHKFTLQYCLWDQFKELESMVLLRSMHLAKFVAEILSSFHLSLAVLKVIDLGDIVQLTPKRIIHFRMLFETLLEYPDNLVWNIFSRVAVVPELEDLGNGLELFIREYVVKNNKNAGRKFKIAKKALNNAAGVLM